MVVAFDSGEKNAKLSLRQTEILQKLSTIVDSIGADCPDEYVHPPWAWNAS
jgi:glutamate--cysteine ligase catalytic subunit